MSSGAVRMRKEALAPWLLAIVLYAALAVVSWRRSGDFLVDFGRELYLPWRLSHGAVLYRDIDSLMGPLAPYANSVVFRLFGSSLPVILATNLAVLATATVLIGGFFHRTVRSTTLGVVLCVFIFVSGFGQLLSPGTYNFITPYSHDVTFGTTLSLLGLVGLGAWGRTEETPGLILAGLALGGTFLTKPEFFLALAGASAFTWVLRWRFGTTPRDRDGSIAFCIAVSLAPLVAIVAFATAVPLSDALAGAAGAWVEIPHAAFGTSSYYAWVAGVDRAGANGWRMLAYSGIPVLLLWAAYLLDRQRGSWILQVRGARLAVTATCALAAVPLVALAGWYNAPSGFPILAVLGLILCVLELGRADGERRRVLLPLTIWGGFSILLLGKILFAVHLGHYGFALAMPATVFLLVVGLEVLPARSERNFGAAPVTRRLASALILAVVGYPVAMSLQRYASRDYPVAPPPNEMLYVDTAASEDGQLLNHLLGLIEREIPRGASMAVLPEGAGLNYLTHRVSSTSHISLMPPELGAAGEDRVLDDLRRDPPSYLVVWPRSLSGYGYGAFAEDSSYAGDVLAWIARAYVPVDSVVAPRSPSRRSLYRAFTIYEYQAGGEASFREGNGASGP